MKTIKALTSDSVDDGAKPVPIPSPKFMRQAREAADGWYFESTSGAKVFVPREELYKLIEAHDPLFAIPIPA